MTLNNINMRALCNGKTLAFQAKDTGSIPVARSRFFRSNYVVYYYLPID